MDLNSAFKCSMMLLGLGASGYWMYKRKYFNVAQTWLNKFITNLKVKYQKKTIKKAPISFDISRELQDDLFIMGNIYVKENQFLSPGDVVRIHRIQYKHSM